MTAYNTKGTKNRIIPKSATPTEIVPTAISSANPAVVTVGDVTGITAGDFAVCTNTGFSELDGKSFIVGTVDSGANTFELLGSDTSATVDTLDASPTIDIYDQADSIIVCLASIDIGAASSSNISTATFCDPSASLPGASTPGTVTMTGYTDKTDAGLAELILAAEDGENRYFYIFMSNEQGYLVAELAFSAISFSVPLEGGYGYTVTATQVVPFKWIHD